MTEKTKDTLKYKGVDQMISVMGICMMTGGALIQSGQYVIGMLLIILGCLVIEIRSRFKN